MFGLVEKYKKLIQVFLALLAITFMTWGIESYTRYSGGNNVATVNGMEISEREFSEQYGRQQEQIRRMFGGSIDPAALDSPEARRALLDSMIDQRLLAGEAARRHLLMSREAIIEAITQAPEFQENGEFSAARYSAFLAERNLTDEQNVTDLQSQLPLQRFVGAVADTAIVPRTVSARLAALQAQKREVSEVRIRAEQFLPQVKIDEAKARAHYDANPEDYRTPERVRAEYLLLSSEALAREEPVTEAEIKAAYDARAAQYRVEEQRRASHILVKTKEQAEQLLQQAKAAPQRFAELAKKHSEDSGSAEQGGDLGWFGPGMMVKPFEDAAFRMKQNETQVVQSEFGFHVLRVTGVQPGKVRGLEEVRKELTAELARQKGARKFSEAAEAFSNLVYEQPDSLQPAAERFGLKVQTTGWIARSGRQELGALDNPKMLAALFSQDAVQNKRNTDAIQVAPSTLAAARVLEHQPSAQRKFEEVKDEIVKLLAQREASELALKDGQARLEKLRKGEDAGVRWSAPRVVSRQDAQGLPADVLRRVVSIDTSKLPAYAGLPIPDAGYLLVRVTRVIEADPRERDPQAAAQVSNAAGAAQLEAFVGALRERADISVNASSLEKQ